MFTPLPQPGQIVHVRMRRYLVEAAEPTRAPGDASRVRLSCLDDDAQGEALDVLWEHEVDGRLLDEGAWTPAAGDGFDAPGMFAAYLHALRWRSVTATDPKLFQAPFRAGIRLDAYQLEPLRKALLLPRVNLFIADDVGLGKTIEAGLIARELLLRKKVDRIVVASPPSMLAQWQDELAARFGLGFVILDRDYVAQVRRERGYGVNPWATHSRFLVSHRLLIDEGYAGPLRDWLGELLPGSLLILDEAHHAAPAGGGRYAIDSKITRAVRDLAPRFEHRLFLSATPHNGHSNSFAALLELLDPQRFCRGVRAAPKLLGDVLVRRLKEDLRGIAIDFPERKVVQVEIDGLPDDAAELLLPRLLDDYRVMREARLGDATRREQIASGLLLSGLQQRLLSSMEAFHRTLRVHRATVEREWAAQRVAAQQQATGPSPVLSTVTDLLADGLSADDDRAVLPEEALADEVAAQFAAASQLSLGPVGGTDAAARFAQERALLDRMAGIADAARFVPDARIGRLVDWIRANMCPGLPERAAVDVDVEAGDGVAPPASWNETRLIIFTEYDDTKRYVLRQLLAAIDGTARAEERIAVYHGPTPLDEREELKRRFNADPREDPLRILICTDAAREGLNLQLRCWNLFHFDVPWNPGRMEQRNGRIDRKLQPQPEVRCHYFFYAQRPEDRILRTLVSKTERIRTELGSMSQVLDDRLAEWMRGGIRRDGVQALAERIEGAGADEASTLLAQTASAELGGASERKAALEAQIERLRTLLDRSKGWLDLSVGQLKDAIDSALELWNAPPLEPVSADDGWDARSDPQRYRFPPLDRLRGADPSWWVAMDALRRPKRRDEGVAEWRANAPLRPVVFEDAGPKADAVVHLHLEHPVVQRLLQRFSAQGFVHHELSRACVAETADALPAVVLIGRLSLYGTGGAVLHDVLVPVTARWVEPGARRGPLTPYARGASAEERTLDAVDLALTGRGDRGIADGVRHKLLASAGVDVGDLRPHVVKRAQEEGDRAERLLQARAAAESKAMRDLLASQLDSVARTAKQADAFQLTLGADREAVRQLQADRRYWARRLVALEAELEREPERVAGVYGVRARRVEVVGVVYLWPVTG